MQNVKKVWERRSHACPSHYTPEWKVKSEDEKVFRYNRTFCCSVCMLSQVGTELIVLSYETINQSIILETG